VTGPFVADPSRRRWPSRISSTSPNDRAASFEVQHLLLAAAQGTGHLVAPLGQAGESARAGG
jgi:hypothetical protein